MTPAQARLTAPCTETTADVAAAPTADLADVQAVLHRAALKVLDAPFEPASTLLGETFDRVVERYSEALSDGVAALRAASAWPLPRNQESAGGDSSNEDRAGETCDDIDASVIDADLAARRRAQAVLRREVRAGRLPGNVQSLWLACDVLAECRDEVSLAAEILEQMASAPDAASNPTWALSARRCAEGLGLLAEVAAACAEQHGRTRAALRNQVDQADPSALEALANAVTRGQRDLIRQTLDATAPLG